MRRLVIALAVVVFAPIALHAQAVKGSLVGNVSDSANLAIPGATVTITEVNTNISYNTTTNENGYYVFSNLKDGTYRVVGELTGFKKTIRDGIAVPVNATVRVDMKMEIGAIEESITVVGESPLLQTDRADTGRLIESVQLTQVPLGFNRNFQGMLVVVPGALRMQRPHSDFFNAQDSLSSNVNGQSRLANKRPGEGRRQHRTDCWRQILRPSDQTVNISTSAYDADRPCRRDHQRR